MPLTLNIDADHASALKIHAGKAGRSASRLVAEFIDGLSDTPPPPSLGTVIQRLRANGQALRERGLLHVAVFGSVARGEEHPGSDVDLMVKVAGDMDAFRLAALKADIVDLLEAPVELVTLEEFNRAFDRSVQAEVVVAF